MRRFLKSLFLMLSVTATALVATLAHAATIGVTFTGSSDYPSTYTGTFESSLYDSTPNGVFAVDAFYINAIDENGVALVFDSSAGAILGDNSSSNVSSGFLQVVNDASGNPSHLNRAPGASFAFTAPYVDVAIPIIPIAIPQTGYRIGFNISGPVGSALFSYFFWDGSKFSDIDFYWRGSYDLSVADPAAVPLPSAMALFATGLAGLGWFARRRRKQAA